MPASVRPPPAGRSAAGTGQTPRPRRSAGPQPVRLTPSPSPGPSAYATATAPSPWAIVAAGRAHASPGRAPVSAAQPPPGGRGVDGLSVHGHLRAGGVGDQIGAEQLASGPRAGPDPGQDAPGCFGGDGGRGADAFAGVQF